MPAIRPPIPRRPRRPHRPGRPTRPRRRSSSPATPRVVVLGDLVLDLVLAPSQPIAIGTDVAGRVSIVQGGSAATTARWLARLGARSSLIAAVGRDAAGRALVKALEADHVSVRAVRVAGARTGRIGVVVATGGERSFVTDRGAALQLSPNDLRADWFSGVDLLHMPAYSLLGAPLSEAGLRAIELARGTGALVSLDLASIGPLLAGGRRAARDLIAGIAPDILFATATEAGALLGRPAGEEGLLEYGTVAVVKRGPKGATVLARTEAEPVRFEVATARLNAADTTGAGDAFDAGFLAAWLGSPAGERSFPASLHRAALAGHRAAGRQLLSPRQELTMG
jgi:ribokinase